MLVAMLPGTAIPWQSFMAHGGCNQAKPTGTPTGFNADSRASGLLFYGIDTGNSTIVPVIGPTLAAGGVPSNTSTAFGTAIGWLGPTADYPATPGNYGYDSDQTQTNAQLDSAMNLADKASGVGYTIATAYYQTGDTRNIPTGAAGFIFGRPSNAGEMAPFANSTFQSDPATDKQVDASVNNNGTIASIGTYTPGSYNLFTSLLMTCLNDTMGSATCKFYANGVQVGSQSGIAATISGIERQLMFGSIYHTDTGRSFSNFLGNVFYGAIANRVWTSAEIALQVSCPYSFLTY